MPEIEISTIASEHLLIPIIGTAPLIVHNFGEKQRRVMLDGMQGRKAPKTKRDPEADYQVAFHRTKDGYGFPALGFKKATVAAARFYGNGVTMTDLRQCMFFRGQISDRDPLALVEITGEPRMREDVVRIARGGTDLRYRPEFPEWSAVLDVVYVTSSLSRGSLLSLIDAGGMGVGVGEWRPEKGGDFGTYAVDGSRDVEVING